MLKASHQEHWCWIQFFKRLTTQSPQSLTCWKWQMNQGYIKCHQVQKRIGIMVTWCLSPVAVPVVNYTLVRPRCAWDTKRLKLTITLYTIDSIPNKTALYERRKIHTPLWLTSIMIVHYIYISERRGARSHFHGSLWRGQSTERGALLSQQRMFTRPTAKYSSFHLVPHLLPWLHLYYKMSSL